MAMALLCVLTHSARGFVFRSGLSGCRGIRSQYLYAASTPWACYHSRRYGSLRSSRRASNDTAYEAFSLLARKEKSWNRLRNLIDLAIEYQNKDTIQSIVDVGTDHGLLAIGLAVSDAYERVIGVDVSSNALGNGGLRLLSDVQHRKASSDPALLSKESIASGLSNELAVEFRISDGLGNLQVGEADAVCIAGMGVNTISKILHSSTLANDGTSDLDYLGCQQLILQPTNSKPRNLMKLYNSLQSTGWKLADERIEYLSSRWYITFCLVRDPDSKLMVDDLQRHVPTSKLVARDKNDPMSEIVLDYQRHHLEWINRDEDVTKGGLHEDDKAWREWVLDALS